jgi:hypothetical protein
MQPTDLKPGQFSKYPPEARKLAEHYTDTLAQLPPSFVPSLLREVIEYDYKFPVERKAVEKELETITALSPSDRLEWFAGFAQVKLSQQLVSYDWVNSPGQFVEQLSAHLWATHQLDAFRAAATSYANRLAAANPPEPPEIPRLGISVIGQGVTTYDDPLFRKLRSYGVHFTQVQPEGALQTMLDVVAERAKTHPIPYGHWYVDGGAEAKYDTALVGVSYRALEPPRAALTAKMRAEIERPGMGPEALRTLMARMKPEDIGLGTTANGHVDPIMARFQLKVLTEASGTQIFATTFAQWTAREALRRAQPVTLLVRFAPRQKQKPMNEMISASANSPELDPVGSLVDADFGSYYNYLNQQRLSGADQSSFVVWFENHSQAVAIGPKWPRNTQSTTPIELKTLFT